MTDNLVIIAVAVMALVTALTRFLPFAVFAGKEKTPQIITRLSKTLPFAIMGMLVVFCLKDISFLSLAGYLPAVISVAVTALLYVWRRNTLLSIIAGTLCNMLLVQLVF
ncbi:MAG: AzlD domain-containing protein [Clostridia bacterium]|nr:AzlD domain-containing protein [Clostridia bacterium]